MSRASLRRKLADLIGLDLHDHDGIRIELHHVPAKGGERYPVHTVSARDLAKVLDEHATELALGQVAAMQQQVDRAETRLLAYWQRIQELETMITTETPTTETTSPTLHERLAKAAMNHSVRQNEKTGDVTTITYSHIKPSAIKSIERDIRDEAVAPWRERIEKQALAIAEEREQHAALRQAGAEMRHQTKIVRDRLFSLTGNYEATDAAIKAFDEAVANDAATTPRVEETPMKTTDHPKWQDVAPKIERPFWSGKPEDRNPDPDAAPSPTDAAGEDTVVLIPPHSVRRLIGVPADQDPDLQARPDAERIDDLVTRADAATERFDMHMRRIEALDSVIAKIGGGVAVLEQRADRASERLDQHIERINAIERRHRKLRKRIVHLEEGSGMAHRTAMKLASDVGTLQGKVERLEARPQPVAEVTPEVTNEMARAFWKAYAGGTFPHQHARDQVRAGIKAALAAKETGK